MFQHDPAPTEPHPPAGTVTVFASAGSWIESDAVRQCHQVVALPGMIHVAGMPDLHPGKGAPIGAAMSSTLLYPHLVGSDIGCGIAVFPIDLKRPEPQRLARQFPDLDRCAAGWTRPVLARSGEVARVCATLACTYAKDCERGPRSGPARDGGGVWRR